MINRVKRIGTGICFLAFPLMLLAGFLLHPNLLSLSRIAEASEWAAEFRGNVLFHLGHMLVLLSVPLIIVVGIRCMRLATDGGAWAGLVGGVLGIFGAFILAVDKGAMLARLTHSDAPPIRLIDLRATDTQAEHLFNDTYVRQCVPTRH
jgi:hypothetical protein